MIHVADPNIVVMMMMMMITIKTVVMNLLTWFLSRPHKIAACDGRAAPARNFKTPFELGRLDSSRWSDMSRKRREPVSWVVTRRCSKAELVTASKFSMPVITTCGFSFLINSIIRSDWRGASITVITSSPLSSAVCCKWMKREQQISETLKLGN